MEPYTIHCRPGDLKRIKITCRCGTSHIAEVPKQVATARTFSPCPGCQAGFTVQMRQDGHWNIERVIDCMEDAIGVVRDVQQPEEEKPETHKHSYIGLRIKISDGPEFIQNPKHLGKMGYIIGEQPMAGGYVTPKIKLDDGTILTGAECWWEPVVS